MSSNKTPKNYIHDQASALLGLGTESIGKTQARQAFLPLVDDLKKRPRTIEITDRETPVAVLLAYEHYAALVSQLSKLTGKVPRRKLDLRGSVVILGDIEAGSRKIAEDFQKAIERSAASL